MKRLLTTTLCFVLLLAGACAPADAYTSANAAYHDESNAYAEARLKIVDGAGDRRAGVTDAQWSRFRPDEAAVIAADSRVYADLKTWERTGVKPASFDSNASALRAAQNRIIALSQEVR